MTDGYQNATSINAAGNPDSLDWDWDTGQSAYRRRIDGSLVPYTMAEKRFGPDSGKWPLRATSQTHPLPKQQFHVHTGGNKMGGAVPIITERWGKDCGSAEEADLMRTVSQDCSECFGTGFKNGFGPRCSKGCKIK